MKFEINKDNVDTAMIILIIAGIVGIIAFFVSWAYDQTGLQFYEQAKGAGVIIDQWKCYVPLFIMIMAIITVIIGILTFIGVKFNGSIVAGEFILIGVVSIVAIIIFGVTTIDGVQIFSKAQVGLWLAMIYSIVVLVVGLLQANTIRKA